MTWPSTKNYEYLNNVLCKLEDVPITKRIKDDIGIVYEYTYVLKEALAAGNPYLINRFDFPLKTYFSLNNRDIPTHHYIYHYRKSTVLLDSTHFTSIFKESHEDLFSKLRIVDMVKDMNAL